MHASLRHCLQVKSCARVVLRIPQVLFLSVVGNGYTDSPRVSILAFFGFILKIYHIHLIFISCYYQMFRSFYLMNPSGMYVMMHSNISISLTHIFP
jgi:hypothetical protein